MPAHATSYQPPPCNLLGGPSGRALYKNAFCVAGPQLLHLFSYHFREVHGLRAPLYSGARNRVPPKLSILGTVISRGIVGYRSRRTQKGTPAQQKMCQFRIQSRVSGGLASNHVPITCRPPTRGPQTSSFSVGSCSNHVPSPYAGAMPFEIFPIGILGFRRVSSGGQLLT